MADNRSPGYEVGLSWVSMLPASYPSCVKERDERRAYDGLTSGLHEVL